jgi:hypothetical protein
MDINFIKMHNPTNAAPEFRGKSHLGDYSGGEPRRELDLVVLLKVSIRAPARGRTRRRNGWGCEWINGSPPSSPLYFGNASR